MLTGSLDGTIKFHDFASMTPTTLRAFKSVDPWETKKSASNDSHAIQHIEFSRLSGGVFLCVTAHPQAKKSKLASSTRKAARWRLARCR